MCTVDRSGVFVSPQTRFISIRFYEILFVTPNHDPMSCSLVEDGIVSSLISSFMSVKAFVKVLTNLS